MQTLNTYNTRQPIDAHVKTIVLGNSSLCLLKGSHAYHHSIWRLWYLGGINTR